MYEPAKKVCPLGHVKTERETGKHYCRECEYQKRIAREAPRRVAAGLPAHPKRMPPGREPVRVCKLGHDKVQRPSGEWTCNKCGEMNRLRREAEKRVARGLPAQAPAAPQATATDKTCKRGHPKVRLASGALVCRLCRSEWRRGVNRLARSGTCLHVSEQGFDGVLNNVGVAVCLTCLAESFATPKTAGGTL